MTAKPVPYEKYKTGLTYDDVYNKLWRDSDDPADWRYKGPSGVLGYWHELKQEMYDDYVRGFEEYSGSPEFAAEFQAFWQEEKVPF